MKQTLPSQAVLKRLLRYEPETGDLFWLPRTESDFKDGGKTAIHSCRVWNANFANKPALQSTCKNGYRHGPLFSKTVKTHRVIWKLVYGEEPGTIDHIDGNRANNALANLRNVTVAENCRNQRVRKNNTSGHLGVWWHAGGKKWAAGVMYFRKAIHLGLFDNIDDALAARDAAHARLGFHPNHGMTR